MTTKRMNPNPIGASGVNRCFSTSQLPPCSVQLRRVGGHTGSEHEDGDGQTGGRKHLDEQSIQSVLASQSGDGREYGLPLGPVGSLSEGDTDDEWSGGECVEKGRSYDPAYHLGGRDHYSSVLVTSTT